MAAMSQHGDADVTARLRLPALRASELSEAGGTVS